MVAALRGLERIASEHSASGSSSWVCTASASHDASATLLLCVRSERRWVVLYGPTTMRSVSTWVVPLQSVSSSIWDSGAWIAV